MLARIAALLVPPTCIACGDGCRPGALLCGRCRGALPWLHPERCRRCGLPAPCAPCPARGAAFDAAWSAVAYDGVARALVHALKFRGALACADVMAAQIAANAPRALLAGALLPAPADPRRRRRRGFDHAALLARALGARTGLEIVDGLLRPQSLPRQLGAGRVERLHRRGIELEARGRAPDRVIVVDDVHTTGATLDACARALRAAGARRVVALTYARTLR